ncbi:MAG: DnaJ domain-containing protein [Nannocystaceae bacterium]|nr:DnaJ domain-containing protein [Nannocystaceae bacterium]
MSAYTEAFWERVVALTQTLDSLSYYHLLDVPHTASREAINEAYYRRANKMHPDRHRYQTDPSRKQALVRLYARFGEAFRVLRSPTLRHAYDLELAAGRARLSNDAQQADRNRTTSPDPKTEHGKRLLDTARTLVRSGNLAGGVAQLQLAAQFEPDSVAIRQELDACRAHELNPDDTGLR